ncbi:hypothetical protein AGMMS49941_04060 [Deferribacterales bacterium]|nr:hypothetical protein AGMMS49941_04060 [Deferribacterales bacterium]
MEFKDSTAEHKFSGANIGASWQYYFGRNFGFEVGFTAMSDDWKEPAGYIYTIDVEVTTIPMLFLVRYPVNKYLDVYGGVGVDLISTSFKQYYFDGSALRRHEQTESFISPTAEAGVNIYLGNFMFGAQAKYVSVPDIADGAYFDAELKSSGVSFVGRAGIAF